MNNNHFLRLLLVAHLGAHDIEALISPNVVRRGVASVSMTSSMRSTPKGLSSPLPSLAPTEPKDGSIKASALTSLTATALMGPFSLTFLPYIACLKWGLPSTKIGSWKSITSIGHRMGGIGTLILPLFLSALEARTQSHVPLALYAITVATAMANLGFGAALITRKVPAYDIPTLRAFAVGVLLGTAFLGSSLLFVAGPSKFYEPFGVLFGAIAVYAAIFACSDALQHARLFLRSKWTSEADGSFEGVTKVSQKSTQAAMGQRDLQSVRGGSSAAVSSTGLGRRHWFLPFERASFKDVFLTNLWKQPTVEALEASVSPPNGVVVFTTSMTAAFALLALLQLRYLGLGSAGMAALTAAEPAFCRWSAYQALLAVVANNFGTFAGTLVIQRRTTQKQAGIFNAIGLMIPVLNIIAFLAMHPGHAGRFTELLLLPSVGA